eukprot:5045662-Amphidinium_carterae.1
MENMKIQTVFINDDSYIDHRLHEKGLGQDDVNAAGERKLQRLLQDYTRRTEPLTTTRRRKTRIKTSLSSR